MLQLEPLIIASLFGLVPAKPFDTLGEIMRAGIFTSRLACLAGIILLLSMTAFADTIRLKDGGVIKGRIVSFNGGKFVVAIGEGNRQRQMTFYSDEIESIQFDSTQTYASKPVPIPTQQEGQPPIVKVSSNVPQNNPPAPATKSTVVITESETKSTTPANRPANTTAKQIPAPVTKQPKTGDSALNKPVELVVNVLADNTANGWTNSGWVVRRGQRIHVSGSGQVSLGKGTSSTPEGRPDVSDEQKLMKGVPTGALIAVIGDDNNEFIYIGGDREFTATRDGALFFGVNEGNLNDNSGKFAVKILITPNDGE
jgi:hypothetical protein